MSTSQTVYLAGPMRGVAGYNFIAFNEAAERLREFGYIVSNPAEHDMNSWPTLAQDYPENWALGTVHPDMVQWVQSQFRWDIEQVIKSDLLVLLPGWRSSRGAILEALVAHVCGIEIAEYEPHAAVPLRSVHEAVIQSIERKLVPYDQ